MNVTDLLLGGSVWSVLPCSLLALGAVFGLLPGLLLRLVVLLYPKQHPRRDELFGELYDPEMGRVERFEWVFQQLETALRQGPVLRRQERHKRRERKRNKRRSGPPAVPRESPDEFDARFRLLREQADKSSPRPQCSQKEKPPTLLTAALRAWVTVRDEGPEDGPGEDPAPALR